MCISHYCFSNFMNMGNPPKFIALYHTDVAFYIIFSHVKIQYTGYFLTVMLTLTNASCAHIIYTHIQELTKQQTIY